MFGTLSTEALLLESHNNYHSHICQTPINSSYCQSQMDHQAMDTNYYANDTRCTDDQSVGGQPNQVSLSEFVQYDQLPATQGDPEEYLQFEERPEPEQPEFISAEVGGQSNYNYVFTNSDELSSSCSDYTLGRDQVRLGELADDLAGDLCIASGDSPPSYYSYGGDGGDTSSSCCFDGADESPLPSKVDSISATRSRLIKEGLKLTIQSKRRAKGLTPTQDLISITEAHSSQRSPDEEDSLMDFRSCELTHEDEERRRRRRERNKIAATKCRNKKKERTQKLAVESTSLESSIGQLRDEISRLELERRSLMDILRNHMPSCSATAVTSLCGSANNNPSSSRAPH